ncbi:MAG TPA: energy-coupling factor ABC transporter permease [Pelomicrobium sp.]|nr:energy-coupling factor ABC transporter permease [Pelomicrobium sp.]
MYFPAELVPAPLAAAAQGAAMGVLGYAVLRAPWRRLADPAQQHVFLGSIVFLVCLWLIRTGVKPGLDLHFLGATALTLMFGPRLALVALAVVLGANTASGAGSWTGFGLSFLTVAAAPVAVTQALFIAADRRLPNHLFVYVFANGFFGAALAAIAAGLATCLLLAAAGVYDWDYLGREYLPFFVLLGWGEALMTGMAVTLMVVYRPQWIPSFDDARYLNRGEDAG